MPTTTARVASAAGLHARPASVFVSTASTFDAIITIALGDGPAVDAKSILQVMGLGAGQGATVRITATGADAEAALASLAEVVQSDLDA